MQAERAPILGVALAMLVLVIECLGLVAYDETRRCRQRTVQAPDEPIGTLLLEDIRFVPQEVDHCRFVRSRVDLEPWSTHPRCRSRAWR